MIENFINECIAKILLLLIFTILTKCAIMYATKIIKRGLDWLANS